MVFPPTTSPHSTHVIFDQLGFDYNGKRIGTPSRVKLTSYRLISRIDGKSSCEEESMFWNGGQKNYEIDLTRVARDDITITAINQICCYSKHSRTNDQIQKHSNNIKNITIFFPYGNFTLFFTIWKKIHSFVTLLFFEEASFCCSGLNDINYSSMTLMKINFQQEKALLKTIVQAKYSDGLNLF